MRDLKGESAHVVATERARVGSAGWGRSLLDRQAPEGWWVRPDDEGWMATTDALADRPYFDGETEPCINGAILAVGSYFGERCDRIVERLLGEQLADGGWNCEAPRARARRSIRPSASSKAY